MNLKMKSKIHLVKLIKILLDRVQGSIIGLALGDALGAHVEFRPYDYMETNPVTDLVGGGTWGLDKGQVSSFFSIERFSND